MVGIYQYLYHKQDVMLILILFPTSHANHTRGSICFIPLVENTQLDCRRLLSSCDTDNKLYCSTPFGLTRKVNNASSLGKQDTNIIYF